MLGDLGHVQNAALLRRLQEDRNPSAPRAGGSGSTAFARGTTAATFPPTHEHDRTAEAGIKARDEGARSLRRRNKQRVRKLGKEQEREGGREEKGILTEVGGGGLGDGGQEPESG